MGTRVNDAARLAAEAAAKAAKEAAEAASANAETVATDDATDEAANEAVDARIVDYPSIKDRKQTMLLVCCLTVLILRIMIA